MTCSIDQHDGYGGGFKHFLFHRVSVYIAVFPLPVAVTIKFIADLTGHPSEASLYQL